MDHQRFLIAVHCDITVWYMTLVMSLNRSIYPFTPERPRDLSVRTPEPAPSGVYILDCASDLCLFENFARNEVPDPSVSSTLPSQRVLCAFALYGLVSYSGSLTLTSSGRCKIRWLNLILEVVAAILAA